MSSTGATRVGYCIRSGCTMGRSRVNPLRFCLGLPLALGTNLMVHLWTREAPRSRSRMREVIHAIETRMRLGIGSHGKSSSGFKDKMSARGHIEATSLQLSCTMIDPVGDCPATSPCPIFIRKMMRRGGQCTSLSPTGVYRKNIASVTECWVLRRNYSVRR